MKTKSIKAILLVFGLMLFNLNTASATIGEKFNQFVGSEFSNMQGIYIIAGIVVASLVVYIVVNHFNKEEEDKSIRHGASHHHRRHHQHHHQHRIIKKTP